MTEEIKGRPIIPSRRDFLGLGGLTLLSVALVSCVPNVDDAPENPNPSKTDSPENGISVANEIEGFYISFDSQSFVDISRRYRVPDANFQNFDIKLTKKSISLNSPIENPGWVITEIKEDGRGYIEIATGALIDEATRLGGGSINDDGELIVSKMASYGVFLGYLHLGIKRDLLDEEPAEVMRHRYLDLVLNNRELLILWIGTLEIPKIPQDENPIEIPPISS